jgi:hypothetical protein
MARRAVASKLGSLTWALSAAMETESAQDPDGEGIRG